MTLKTIQKSLIAGLFLALITNITYTKEPTAEQALATIGYLSKQTQGQESRQINVAILHEDLSLFIKKLVSLAKTKDSEKCPDLFTLDKELKTNFENIEIKLLLDALANAAYLIKNRAEKLCSREEIQHLNDELHRWCDYATGLVNGGQ